MRAPRVMRDLKVEVEYVYGPTSMVDGVPIHSRYLTWTLRTDRSLRAVLASVQHLHPDAHTAEVSIVRRADA